MTSFRSLLLVTSLPNETLLYQVFIKGRMSVPVCSHTDGIRMSRGALSQHHLHPSSVLQQAVYYMNLIIYAHQSRHWLQSDFLSLCHTLHSHVNLSGWLVLLLRALFETQSTLLGSHPVIRESLKMINDCRGVFCVSSGTHLRFLKVAIADVKIERTLYVFTL